MTVNTVSPAIISRAEFNLNAGQTKTPQLVRMDFTNLITNGDFTTNTTGWTAGATTSGTAAISTSAGGILVDNNSVASRGNAYQSIGFSVGRTYRKTADVTQNSAGAKVAISAGTTTSGQIAGETLSTGVTSAVAFSFVATAATLTSILQVDSVGATSSATFDNIILYEADPSDDALWLRLPYGYSVGRTGMIVRDGVILHPSDYTEIKDSGQTWIKPLVAPGVSTEFSIWGSAS